MDFTSIFNGYAIGLLGAVLVGFLSLLGGFVPIIGILSQQRASYGAVPSIYRNTDIRYLPLALFLSSPFPVALRRATAGIAMPPS